MNDVRNGKASILIIDDDEQVRTLLKDILSPEYSCTALSSAEEALAVLGTIQFGVVISDINMPGMSGLELAPRISVVCPDSTLVMISGQQAIESAIEALRVGAFDYITKPLDIRHVQVAVARAHAHHDLLKQKRQYEENLEELVRVRTAEVQRLAYYDQLTGFPNRALLLDRLEQAVLAAKNDQPIGVLLVSLDRFKKVADALGHAAGDALLQDVAKRLRDCAHKGATVARLDYAEFAFLFNPLSKPEALAELAQSIHTALKRSFVVGSQELYVNASIGISVFPIDGNSAETILKNAGAALYRAKTEGGNNHLFYTAQMNAEAVKRLELETDLRGAIPNKQIVVHYQPVVDLLSENLVGVEALVRWQHPKLGLLSPAHFIDLAEDIGVIREIDEHVLESGCRQIHTWHEAGLKDLRIAVNVSARHFQNSHLLERLKEILAATGVDPQSVELEITESSLMEKAESAIALLSEIRKIGVRVSIDDFGTGYSSFAYLTKLPVSCIKIDKSFVTNIATEPDSHSIVSTIISLAHSLKLSVVAEGVETDEQLRILKALQCDELQGYIVSPPVADEQFWEWHARYSPGPIKISA